MEESTELVETDRIIPRTVLTTITQWTAQFQPKNLAMTDSVVILSTVSKRQKPQKNEQMTHLSKQNSLIVFELLLILVILRSIQTRKIRFYSM